MLGEKRIVGRQVGSSGEVAQEVSAPAPVGPLPPVCTAAERLVSQCCSTELFKETNDCRWKTCCSPSRSVCRMSFLPSLLYCSPPPGLGVRRLTPPLVLPPSQRSSFHSSPRVPAVARCEVSSPFSRLRAPESAKATSKMPRCTAEEEGHLVLKENVLLRGQSSG